MRNVLAAFALAALVFGGMPVAIAQVEHASINSRQFEVGEIPQFKINIVSQPAELSRLIFYVNQVTDGEYKQQKLSGVSINPFLLQLNGTEPINDKNARLVVAEFTPSKLVMLTDEAIFDAPYSIDTNKHKRDLTASEISVEHHVDSKSIIAKEGTCLISRDNNDTLWRIANRYKAQWNTSVYGAMLSIFETNMGAFSKQRIDRLLKDVPLYCPSTFTLAQYNNIKVDKEVFETIAGK